MSNGAADVTDQNFKAEVLDFDGVTIVDFWAPWCGPCQMLTPIVEEVADAYKDNPKVKVVKLMVDDNPQTAQKYNVMSIPTLKYFKGGEVVNESVGVVTKDDVEGKLKAAL